MEILEEVGKPIGQSAHSPQTHFKQGFLPTTSKHINFSKQYQESVKYANVNKCEKCTQKNAINSGPFSEKPSLRHCRYFLP